MGDTEVCVSNTTVTSCHHQVNRIVGSALTEQVMVTNGWTSVIVPSSLRLIIIISAMNDQIEELYTGKLHVEYLC